MRVIYRRAFRALGWVSFLACLWFVLGFTLTARQRMADIVEDSAALANESTDLSQHEKINSMVVAAAVKLAEAMGFYVDRLAGGSEAPISADLFATARRAVVDGRLRLASAEGAVGVGVLFAAPLGGDAAVLWSRLQRMNVSMGILNTFFDDYLTSGPATAMHRLQEQGPWIGAEPIDVQALQLRAWDEEATLRDEVSAAKTALDRSLASFVVRLFVSTLGAMYCAAFLGISLRASWQGHAGEPAA